MRVRLAAVARTGEHLEQQFGAASVELDVVDFVHQQQVETAVAGDEAGEAAVVGGGDELVDERGAGGVAEPSRRDACQP